MKIRKVYGFITLIVVFVALLVLFTPIGAFAFKYFKINYSIFGFPVVAYVPNSIIKGDILYEYGNYGVTVYFEPYGQSNILYLLSYNYESTDKNLLVTSTLDSKGLIVTTGKGKYVISLNDGSFAWPDENTDALELKSQGYKIKVVNLKSWIDAHGGMGPVLFTESDFSRFASTAHMIDFFTIRHLDSIQSRSIEQKFQKSKIR